MVATAAEATNKHMDKVDAAKTTLIETGAKVKDGINKAAVEAKAKDEAGASVIRDFICKKAQFHGSVLNTPASFDSHTPGSATSTLSSHSDVSTTPPQPRPRNLFGSSKLPPLSEANTHFW